MEETRQTNFDIKDYATKYKGHTKIMRLLCIAEYCGGGGYVDHRDTMELTALRIAYDKLKRGYNTRLLREVAEKINGRLGPNYVCDDNMCERVDRNATEQKEMFERIVKEREKNTISKLSSGCERCGDFYSRCGEFTSAYNWYRKGIMAMHSFLTAPPEFIRIHKKASMALVMDKKFEDAEDLFKTLLEAHPTVVESFSLMCSRAVCSLGSGKYESAADQFIALMGIRAVVKDPDFKPYEDLVIRRDIATYGSLCALATFDRQKLESKFEEKITVSRFTPPDVRECVGAFIARRYTECMDHLPLLRRRLVLDVYMHEHIDTLFGLIQGMCLREFATACSTIDLQLAADTFKMPVSSVEQKLSRFISRNLVLGQIDRGVFYGHHFDREAFQSLETAVAELQAVVGELLANIHSYNVGEEGEGALAEEEM